MIDDVFFDYTVLLAIESSMLKIMHQFKSILLRLMKRPEKWPIPLRPMLFVEIFVEW